ncbi:helix-turn-helix domain-containing protein [Acidithiobacillus sp. M4-SHS-6]|uniref:helix-turn-helix domain-containing protein n=1 Tax=Acidithiobacillus sp. M4-SHS-6 TaxID=3383024 RepID=UPI0039BE28E5
MTKNFSTLRSRTSADAQSRSAAKAQVMQREMPSQELRLTRGLSQKTLADIPGVQQPAIAKMEKRPDMYLSALRSHIQAMGGFNNLRIRMTEKQIIQSSCLSGSNISI